MLRDHAERLALTVFAAYPETKLREGTAELYVKYLAGLDEPAAARAIDELIQTSDKLPTIAAIKTRITETRLELPSAADAYLSIFDREITMHPLTRYVARVLGGEYNIRTSELPNATRSQFLSYYDDKRAEVVRRGELPKHVLELERAATSAAAEAGADDDDWQTEAALRLDGLGDTQRDELFAEATATLAAAYGLRVAEADKFGLPAPLIRGEAIRLLAVRDGLLEASPAPEAEPLTA